MYMGSPQTEITIVSVFLSLINKKPSRNLAHRRRMVSTLTALQKHPHLLPSYYFPIFILKLAFMPMIDRPSGPQRALTRDQQAWARHLDNDEESMSNLGNGSRKHFPTGTVLLPTERLCDCRRTTTEARLLIQADFQAGRNWLGMESPDRGSVSETFDGRQASRGQITICSQPCNTKIHEPRDS